MYIFTNFTKFTYLIYYYSLRVFYINYTTTILLQFIVFVLIPVEVFTVVFLIEFGLFSFSVILLNYL
jgi:hypothetical protein